MYTLMLIARHSSSWIKYSVPAQYPMAHIALRILNVNKEWRNASRLLPDSTFSHMYYPGYQIDDLYRQSSFLDLD